MSSSQRPLTATLVTLAYLSVLVFAWGGNYTLVKIALEDSGPLTFNAIRFAGAAIVIGTAMAAFGQARHLLPLPSERVGLAVIGFLQVSIITVLTSVAMLWIEAGRTVLIAYSMAGWAMLFSIPLLGERVGVQLLCGAILGIAGLAVLTEPWQMTWGERDLALGSAVALLGTMGWALGAVLYRRRQWKSPYWSQVFWQIACGTILTMTAALLLESESSFTLSPSLSAIIIYNWLVPTSLGFWCWARALGRTSVTSAGQFLLLSPVFGVLLSNWVLDEPLRTNLLVSATLIIAGAYLSLRADSQHVRASA